MVSREELKEAMEVLEDYTENELDLRMLEEWFELAFRAGRFGKYKLTDMLALKSRDYRGYTYFVKRVPTKLLSQKVQKRLSKEQQVAQMIQQQQLQRPPVFDGLDTRTPNLYGKKMTGAGKDTRVIKRPRFDPDYRPAPLPDFVTEKLTDTNKEWLDKKLDADAEKEDSERRFT